MLNSEYAESRSQSFNGGEPDDELRPDRLDTVVNALARAVDRAGDKVFLDVQGDTITYAGLDRRSTRLANSLAGLGIEKGATVVTLLDTSVDVVATWFAINKLGALWVPINNAYKQEFLRHQIADAGARLIICDPVYLDRLLEISDRLDQVSLILCRSQGPFPPCSIPIQPFDEYRGSDDTPIATPIEPSDLACLIYTSGTTGPSKGCMISHNYMCMQGRQQRRCMPETADEVTWTCLPLFHSSAQTAVMGALVAGHRVAIWPRFSVTTFWSDIEQSGARNAILMASIFALIAHAAESEAEKRCFGQLRMIVGHPITPEIRKVWKERFGVATASSWAFGQTEGSRVTLATMDDNPPETSAGRPAEEFEVKIFDKHDRPVPEGEIGEIVFRPKYPHVMFEGYWRRPEDTSRAWRNLWMHTGDLGRMENGYLYFADRQKDYLRCRGENVSSFELERTYIANDWVQEVAVHATGVQKGEDDIKVTIVLREEATPTEEDVCRWSIDNLPHFAVPRYYEFRKELPKNPTGRVQKFVLRDEGVTATTWDRDAAGIIVRRKL